MESLESLLFVPRAPRPSVSLGVGAAGSHQVVLQRVELHAVHRALVHGQRVDQALVRAVGVDDGVGVPRNKGDAKTASKKEGKPTKRRNDGGGAVGRQTSFTWCSRPNQFVACFA